MSRMLKPITPKLTFLSPEHIAAGVVVNHIDFALNKNTPPFTATYFQVAPDAITPLDQHQVEELWIVLQGTAMLHYEGKAYRIAKQDSFYFSAYKKHQVYNDSDQTLIICSLYW